MPLPEPAPGLVIRYSYLWAEEHERGQDEGVKDRPCAFVMMAMDDAGEKLVTVLPVTPQSHYPATSGLDPKRPGILLRTDCLDRIGNEVSRL